MNKCLPQFALLLCVVFYCQFANATHIRGGQVQLKKIPGSARSYQIVLQLYVDTESTVPAGGSNDAIEIYGPSNFHYKIQVPEITQSSGSDIFFEVIDYENHIAIAQYTCSLTFPSDGYFTVGYTEINRNAGVVNFSNSVSTQFHIETVILIDDNSVSTPTNLAGPLFYAHVGEQFLFSVGAYHDEDDIQVYYRTVVPKAAHRLFVSNYELPENFKLNPFTGQITWDGLFNGIANVGEYTFAVEIVSVRKGKVIGRMVRDFQVLLVDENVASATIDCAADDEDNNSLDLTTGLNEFDVVGTCANAKNTNMVVTSSLADKLTVSINNESQWNQRTSTAKLAFDNTSEIAREIPYLINARFEVTDTYNQKRYLDYTILVNTNDIRLAVPAAIDSLNEIKEEPDQFIPFPNPTTGPVFVERSARDVKVYDTQGKPVPVEVEDGRISFPFFGAPIGVYMLTFRRSNGKLVGFRIKRE